MRFLGLTPDAVAARSPGARIHPLQSSPLRSAGFGALAFGAVSLAVFGTWAAFGPEFYRHLGELGAYLVWAAMFIGFAGLALGKLVSGTGNAARFLACFAIAFALYAAGWMVAWFALRNKTGELAGALAGTAVFAAILCPAFGAARSWPAVALALFAGNAAGYFAGDVAYARLGGTAGKLAWGLLYGIGFGAAIGFALQHVQAEIRRRLQSAPPR